MAHDASGGLAGWDLEGFHSGGDTEVWKRLGAHQVTLHDDERGEIHGTRFAVWAPNAQAVRLNADFNWWTGDAMQLIPGSGVWGLFVEGVGEGTLYKYNILGADGQWQQAGRRRLRLCPARQALHLGRRGPGRFRLLRPDPQGLPTDRGLPCPRFAVAIQQGNQDPGQRPPAR